MSIARFIGVAALLAAMIGCKWRDPLPLSPRQFVPGQAMLDVRPTPEGVLRIEPSRSDCGASAAPVRVAVTWDASGLERRTDGGVLLGVMDAGWRWKTFASASGAAGRAETGEWVVPGTTFFLVDGRTKRVLAQAAYLQGLCGN